MQIVQVKMDKVRRFQLAIMLCGGQGSNPIPARTARICQWKMDGGGVVGYHENRYLLLLYGSFENDLAIWKDTHCLAGHSSWPK